MEVWKKKNELLKSLMGFSLHFLFSFLETVILHRYPKTLNKITKSVIRITQFDLVKHVHQHKNNQ